MRRQLVPVGLHGDNEGGTPVSWTALMAEDDVQAALRTSARALASALHWLCLRSEGHGARLRIVAQLATVVCNMCDWRAAMLSHLPSQPASLALDRILRSPARTAPAQVPPPSSATYPALNSVTT